MKDLTNQVKTLSIETRHSSKSDKDYDVLVVAFKNGYKYESFLKNEQSFILETLLQTPGNH